MSEVHTLMSRRPFPFSFYVFFSKAKDPTEQERESGVYLVETPDARYLQKFFDPLYESAGIGISTSDDEVIAGRDSLAAIAEALRKAIEEVRTQRDEWPVTVGYRFEAFQETPEVAIVQPASRARLLEFLERVDEIVRRADEVGGYVHFGGGG